MGFLSGLIDFGSKLADSIKDVGGTVKDMLSSGAQKSAEIISNIGSAVTSGFDYVAKTVSETASKAIEVAEKVGSTVKSFISSNTSSPKAQEVAERSASALKNTPSGVVGNTSNSVTISPRETVNYTTGVSSKNISSDAVSGFAYISAQKETHSQEAPGTTSQQQFEILSKTIPTEPTTQEQVTKAEMQAIAEVQEDNRNVIEQFIDTVKSIPERVWAEIKTLGGVAKEKAEEVTEKVVEGAKAITSPITQPVKSTIDSVTKWLPLIALVGILVGVAYYVRTFRRWH